MRERKQTVNKNQLKHAMYYIIDNDRINKTEKFVTKCKQNGLVVFTFPSYFPKLNKIEKMEY